jgi:hypothetical protein
MPATQSRQIDNGTMTDEELNAAIVEAQRRRWAAIILVRRPGLRTRSSGREATAPKKNDQKERLQHQKTTKREPTAPRIPTWSPTVVLTRPDDA